MDLDVYLHTKLADSEIKQEKPDITFTQLRLLSENARIHINRNKLLIVASR